MRRRFQHNQEDCTITVLELLPTAADNIIEALPSEKITQHLQQKKAERLGKGAATSDVAPSDLSSGAPSAADEDGRSLSSFQSGSYVHASQMGASSSSNGESRSPSSKAQLWNDLKISCQSSENVFPLPLILMHRSNYEIFHSPVHSCFAESIDSYSTQSPGPKELSLERCLSSFTSTTRSYNQPGRSRRR